MQCTGMPVRQYGRRACAQAGGQADRRAGGRADAWMRSQMVWVHGIDTKVRLSSVYRLNLAASQVRETESLMLTRSGHERRTGQCE